MSQVWSWVLTVTGVTAIWLAGRGNRVGWAVGFCGQVLWVAYAVVSEQWGFLVSAALFGGVYARNWLVSRPRPAEPEPVLPIEVGLEQAVTPWIWGSSHGR